MCRQTKRIAGWATAGAAALAVTLGVLLPTEAAAIGSPSGLNGPGAGGLRIALGDLVVSSPASCAVGYTLQVQTELGSGDDTFELQIYDDGLLIQSQPLSAPADGGVHALAGSLQLQHAVSQASPGIGVYLVDSGVILDFVDPADVVCGLVEIPTLDTVGAWILGGLLLASALIVMRRPRRVL